ncbi:MAG: hypothetical protein KDA89_21830, partial [Planctomycetaceae bacterium]|nr:hypothetical protein [Planctomycetaceae bacterium]
VCPSLTVAITVGPRQQYGEKVETLQPFSKKVRKFSEERSQDAFLQTTDVNRHHGRRSLSAACDERLCKAGCPSGGRGG